MLTEDISRKIDDYYKRLESADSVSEKLQIGGELEIYVRGIIDSMENSTEKAIGLIYVMLLNATNSLSERIHNSKLIQDNLEKRLDQIEIELDIKSKHK